jgi:hypothetical protein
MMKEAQKNSGRVLCKEENSWIWLFDFRKLKIDSNKTEITFESDK